MWLSCLPQDFARAELSSSSRAPLPAHSPVCKTPPSHLKKVLSPSPLPPLPLHPPSPPGRFSSSGKITRASLCRAPSAASRQPSRVMPPELTCPRQARTARYVPAPSYRGASLGHFPLGSRPHAMLEPLLSSPAGWALATQGLPVTPGSLPATVLGPVRADRISLLQARRRLRAAGSSRVLTGSRGPAAGRHSETVPGCSPRHGWPGLLEETGRGWGQGLGCIQVLRHLGQLMASPPAGVIWPNPPAAPSALRGCASCTSPPFAREPRSSLLARGKH